MSTLTLCGIAVAGVAAVRGLWSPCGLSVLTSLNPVSERGRGHRFWVTACWYVAGAVAGGAALGAVSAAAPLGYSRHGLPAPLAQRLAAVTFTTAVAADSPRVPFALPVHPRQVNERWLVDYRRWIYAGGFGAQLGAGFATYIMTAGVYFAAAMAVFTGDPADALSIGLVFGTVRGLGILLAAPVRTPGALRALAGRLDRLSPASLTAAAATSALVAAIAAWHIGGLGAAAAALICGIAVLTRHPVRRMVPATVPAPTTTGPRVAVRTE